MPLLPPLISTRLSRSPRTATPRIDRFYGLVGPAERPATEACSVCWTQFGISKANVVAAYLPCQRSISGRTARWSEVDSDGGYTQNPTRRRGRPEGASIAMGRTVPAASRALDIMELFLDEPLLSAGDVVSRPGLPPPTLHELLVTLVDRRYLVHVACQPTRYRLGVRVFQLG